MWQKGEKQKLGSSGLGSFRPHVWDQFFSAASATTTTSALLPKVFISWGNGCESVRHIKNGVISKITSGKILWRFKNYNFYVKLFFDEFFFYRFLWYWHRHSLWQLKVLICLNFCKVNSNKWGQNTNPTPKTEYNITEGRHPDGLPHDLSYSTIMTLLKTI